MSRFHSTSCGETVPGYWLFALSLSPITDAEFSVFLSFFAFSFCRAGGWAVVACATSKNDAISSIRLMYCIVVLFFSL